jgi:hypothetical protein
MKRVATIAAIAFVVLVAGGAAADTFQVRLVSQTNSTITLGWDPQPGYGYLFSAGGTLVSRTNDASRSSVKFSKVPSGQYDVDVIVKGANGHYPPPAAGDTTPPSAPPNLRVGSRTQTQIVVAWDAANDNVAVTNYRVYRDGNLIGQGAGSSGGFLNQWTDNNRACGTTYQYGVEAQDAAGNTSARSALTAATLACNQPPAAACADGQDNDGDGKTDYPNDPGCSSTADTDETDPAPPPTGTISSSQCASLASQSGTTIANVTINGGCTVTATNITFDNVTASGGIEFRPTAHGGKLLRSRVLSFYIFGADNIVVDGTDVNCNGQVKDGTITWDEPAGNPPNNWTIKNGSYKNCVDTKPDDHSQAIYIGYSVGGLVENTTFTNNGSTSHIFLTNFGNQFNGSSYPRNICIRGNTFGSTGGAFFDINFHANVSSVGPATTGIKIDPDNVMPHGVTDRQFILDC